MAREVQVKLCGEIDISSAGELSRMGEQLLEPERVIFDVSGLEYADTTFLRFLIHLRNHTNKTQSGAVKLVGVSRRLRRILDVTGLSHLFALEPAA